MNKIAIIIPSRLDAKRLPNKPLELINKREMILHVYDLAVKAKIGGVFVATPDQTIIDTVKRNGGKAIMTKKNHLTGTDRVFEVFENELKKNADIIINLQGDMPNLNPVAIKYLVDHMKKNKCDIGTLASNISSKIDLSNSNVCKVVTDKDIAPNKFSSALDFYRNADDRTEKFIYHHIGIYAFTSKALIRYVNLKRSKLEIERKLEQLRALENNMKIDVGFIENFPLSVDTKEDLLKIKKIMEN
jgi:3-deoxy-manno-octulosonate cytidylyltransferase (CMP-KDO synthetase)